MKFSFFCMNTYHDPAKFGPEYTTYPMPSKYYDPEVGIRSVEDHLEMVRLADRTGFDWVSASEHHGWHILQVPNASVLLGAITQVTKRMKIAWMGPLVSMNNPVRVAEEAAMLDQLSGGRLILLCLRGTPNEFLSYGARPDETRPRTQEAIELIERAWSEPRPFSWQGRYFKFRTVSVWPGVTQRPVPIISSGNSLESATFAAKHRHGIGISYYPVELVADLVAFYKKECERFGWEPSPEQILYRCFGGVGESDEHAEDLEQRYYGGGGGLTTPISGRGKQVAGEFKVPEPPKRIGTDADPGGTKDKGAQGFALGKLAFKGSAETVVEQVREFVARTGVGVIDISFNGGGLTKDEVYASMQRFGEDVIPHVRDTDGGAAVREVSGVAH
jgi:alkanesulfonate monooxygenase SsuD/methylene tetrahydromethanopterin reductase-like flavin-dependent oxidoreductase (luciferase family)